MSDNVVPFSEPSAETTVVPAEVDRLQQELTKWRERVPPLAIALKERSEEAAGLKEQICGLENELKAARAMPAADTGSRARKVLIQELETKCDQVNGKYQQAEGLLRTREIELDDLRQELESWKSKWSTLADSADQQDMVVAAERDERQALAAALTEQESLSAERENLLVEKQAQLEELQRELDLFEAECMALKERNEKIFETTDLANRQILSLGEDLKSLRQRQQRRDEEHAAAFTERDRQQEELLAHHAKQSNEQQEELQAQHANQWSEQREELLAQHAIQLSEQQEALQAQHAIQLSERQEALQAQHAIQLSEQQAELEQLEQRFAQKLADQLKQHLAQKQAELTAVSVEIQSAELQFQEALASERQIMERAQAAHIEALRQDFKSREAQHLLAVEAQVEMLESRQTALSAVVQQSAVQQQLQNQATISALHAHLALAEEHFKICMEADATENQHLQNCLDQAQLVVQQREQERREISTQVTSQADQNLLLQEQNDDLSASLEDKVSTIASLESDIRNARRELQSRETATQGQRHAASQAELRTNTLRTEIRDSNDEISRLKEKIQRREDALSAAQTLLETERESYKAELAKRLPESEEEPIHQQVADLQLERANLKDLIRERSEEVTQIRMQLDLSQREPAQRDNDSKLILVLNQQLEDARAENGRLAAKLRASDVTPTEVSEIPRAKTENAVSSEITDNQVQDDLTGIKGIGDILSRQLKNLGVTCLQQIADLEESAIARDDHPLYTHRARISRDRWVEQATALLSEKSQLS